MAYTKEQRAKKETGKTPTTTTTRKTTPKKDVSQNTGGSSPTPIAKKKPIVTNIPRELEVPVISGFDGLLHYESKRSGAYADWDEYGAVEYLTISDLVTMRNSDRRFFEDNWIFIGDTDEFTADEIYKFLKVDRYYKEAYSPDNIEDLFDLSPKEIVRKIAVMSSGMKNTVASMAQRRITDGMLDSNRLIDALSEALNVEFVRG